MAKRIFVVDDMPDFLELMEDVLSEAGYKVHTFTVGAEAIAAARDVRPDLLITDLRMGEESGFDLLEALRNDPVTRNVPTLLCTAATMDVEEQFQPRGIDDVPVLYKPFDMQQLLARVREIVDRSAGAS